jgi:hypothetical protein
MPYTINQDPFTQIHGAIWSALTSNQTWSAFVPIGNRVSAIAGQPASMSQMGNTINGISAQPNYIKEAAVEPADTPEVRIAQRNFAQDDSGTSGKNVGFIQTFLIQLGTSTLLQDLAPLNQLKFLTLVALEKSRQVNPTLGLDGLVRMFTLGAALERDADPMNEDGESMGVKVWYAVWPITVYFQLPNSVFMSIP